MVSSQVKINVKKQTKPSNSIAYTSKVVKSPINWEHILISVQFIDKLNLFNVFVVVAVVVVYVD